MAMYLFNPTLALSLFMGKGKCCSIPFFILGWAGNWIVANRAFTWVGFQRGAAAVHPEVQEIPRAESGCDTQLLISTCRRGPVAAVTAPLDAD